MKGYGFTALAVPGLVLAGAIGFFAFGNGPKLEPVPERMAAVEQKQETKGNVLQLSTPVPPVKEAKNIKKEKAQKKEKTVKLVYTKQEGGYKDGSYTGSATGYGGPITVQVVIRGGKIASVNILSASGETPSFLAMARSVTGKIVSAQSPNVDGVSGATYSSNGIINATIVALRKAGATNVVPKNTKTNPVGKTPTPADKQDKSSEKKKPTPAPTKMPKGIRFKDGTYYGSGEGFGGIIEAKVVIQKNKISGIDIVSAEYETPEYFANAKKILVSMKKKQSPEVDVISGATYSSNGIKDAVREALSKAVVTESASKPTSVPTPTPKPTETVKPTPTPAPTLTPAPTDEVGEDGSVVTVTTIPYEKVVEGAAVCYPDDNEDFEEYPIDIKITINGEKIQKTTIKDEVETVEEENTYSVTDISFSEDTRTLAKKEGNWLFLNRAAQGYGGTLGVFNQLLANNQAEKVDAVSGATCSSDAIWKAFMDGMKKLAADEE